MLSEKFVELLKMEYAAAHAAFYLGALAKENSKRHRERTPEYWASVLRDYPELAEYFTGWTDLSVSAWGTLLAEQPQFADRCTSWERFDLEAWRTLLRHQPQLRDYCPERYHPMVLSGLLASGKFIATEIDTSGFTLEDWFYSTKHNPEAWPDCPCKKDFTSAMWRSILFSSSALASECPYVKDFFFDDWIYLVHLHPELVVLRDLSLR